MPPKKAAAAQAEKKKAVEDKTFGLKNKSKSAKVQKYVQQVQKSAQGPVNARAEPTRKDKKRAEEERAKELAELFALTIKQPKVPPGVDPKTMVCEYFRHGQCTKGFKCKFSHDLALERKTAKADLFQDRRDGEGEDEGMEDWDQEMLEKAIAQKHGNDNQPTQIICKFFLEAVEKKQYGWFWQCPNGKDCKYRHALPPGYVLKSQMKELLELEAANRVTVEEEIEEERAKVDAKTPVTEESFALWVKAKQAAKAAREEEGEEERKKKGGLTGREIFLEEGFVAEDDLGASDAIVREGDEEGAIRRMEQQANDSLREAQAVSRAAGAAPSQPSSSGGAAGAGKQPGSSSGGGGGGAPAPKLDLSAQEADELFGDDDDDDEDELLQELEQDLQKKAAL